MNPEQYARIKEIFAQARELSGAARREYLAESCGNDDEIRTEVEDLLEVDAARTNDAFDRALSDDEEFGAASSATRPRRIGHYRILSVCGSGGMGTVYEAEQDTPQRRVALKVIQSAAPRPDLLRRFRRETEILARLQHPGIAQIFEAGEFEQDGVSRPFFAMEFIDGAPLLNFAAKQALDVSARLDVFARICEAMHYAHQQGVVHRDLKPDNIFVVESSSTTASKSQALAGQPKILDFGVASLTDSEARMTKATGAGELLGSVHYMSPEQATGNIEEIDARSDVYALGVLLFELLTGTLPYAVKHRALADALHTIRYDEPNRLGSADPGLRGDLETIVGKCLEKDRDRRYESVAMLAEDVRRYREFEPISARPPSTWYQLRKFTQRNRALVGSALTTALAIVVGAAFAVLMAINATRHANDAREARARAEREAYRTNLMAASALFEASPAQARKFLDAVPEARRGWEWQLLSSTLSSALLEFGEVLPRMHEDPTWSHVLITDMQLLANGEQVVALSAEAEFRIWRTRTGDVVRTITAPEPVREFAASRDGNLLAAALEGGRVVTCNTEDAEPTWTTWFESDTRVFALAVSPTGDRIAIDRDAEVRFGTPDAWHTVETGPRTPFLPAELEFSRDGTQLARLYENVILLDVATGEPIGEPMVSGQIHWALTIAPDMTRVAIGQYRRELRVFDPATGEMEFELLGHGSWINDVAHSSGNRVASVSSLDGTIRVWDLARREPIAVFDAPNTTRAEFLDDDHVLSLTDGRFRLWTLQDRRSRRLDGGAHVFGVVFSGDGESLATSAPWRDVIVWDALEGTPLHRATAHHRDHVMFDREGERLLQHVYGGAHPGSTQPWYGGPEVPLASNARPRIHCSLNIEEGELRLQGASLPFEQGGFHVFRTEHGTRSGDGQLRAFVDGEELALPPSHRVPDLGPHPQLRLGPGGLSGSLAEVIVFDGRLSDADAQAVDSYLASRRAGADAELPAIGGVLAHFRADAQTIELGENERVQRWIATNDPRLVLDVRGGPQAIRLVTTADGLPAHIQVDQGYGVNNWLEMPLPQATVAESITVCWLGRFGATGVPPWFADWTAYSIESIDVWTDRDERITKYGAGCARSPDGRYDVQLIPDPKLGGCAIVREVATGHCVAHFDGGDYHYFGVSFHPDGRRLACSADDGTIDIFDVETRELVKRIEAHEGYCWDVAFSPDGKLIASGGNDNALRLWDAETYERLLDLPGHQSYVRCVNWSPDGTRLVSGSGDHSVHIWDITPRSERYAQLLARRALEGEVAGAVRELYAANTGDRGAVAQAIGERFGDDAARRRAALRVLARVE